MMRRSRALVPFLLAFGLTAARLPAASGGGALECPPEKSVVAPAPPSPRALGRLARKCNQVEGQLSAGNPEPLRQGQEVVENLEVTTGAGSAARFALGKAMAVLTMGPQSRFLFRPGLFSAPGEIEKFDFWIEFGKLRWAAVPNWADAKRQTVLGIAPHEVHIETRAAKIVLYGTDVYLTVDRESGATILYVAEGSAEVTGAGRTVRVADGQWTSVDPGEPPTPPAPFGPAGPAAGGPAFHADQLVEDFFFDLRNPRLNLPK